MHIRRQRDFFVRLFRQANAQGSKREREVATHGLTMRSRVESSNARFTVGDWRQRLRLQLSLS